MNAFQLFNARSIGIALLATVIIFMVGAFAAAYFRQWPLPSTPLEKLTLIANDRVGWTTQAILFPLAFLATTILFGVITGRLPGPGPRWLAIRGNGFGRGRVPALATGYDRTATTGGERGRAHPHLRSRLATSGHDGRPLGLLAAHLLPAGGHRLDGGGIGNGGCVALAGLACHGSGYR
ncbi:MAG: hypothetical protein IPL78_31120 [Chloroflexi bacterium]|nr:hypothetical protein [Chloroflexota bacterium]